MKKNILWVLLLLSCWIPAIAQKQNNMWYFGGGTGINFNSGSPVFTPLSNMDAPEGCASIADANGNLQFYTHGQTIWTKNHTVMQNGLSIHGLKTAAQSSFIVPRPGNPSRYFLFTVDPTIRALVTGLKVNEIDMAANGGLGTVSAPNISLDPNTTEHLTAVRHQNQQDVWVVVVDQQYQEFKAYLVTSAGVGSTAVKSQVNFTFPGAKPVKGCMKFSPDGRKLAINIGVLGTLVYQFDAATGRLTNPYQIPHSLVSMGTYGVEFSPNNRYLYVSDRYLIRQYDLAAGTPADVIASGYTVIMQKASSLQLGPDNRIYIALEMGRIGSIQNANQPPASIAMDTLFLPHNAFSHRGLPQFLQAAMAPPAIQHTSVCSADSMTFSLSNSSAIHSVKWTFGDPVTGAANTSFLPSPKHLFSGTGTFTVTATYYIGPSFIVLSKDVSIDILPRISLVPKDTVYCETDRVRLLNAYPPNTGAEKYQWYLNGNPLSNQTISYIAGKTGWYKLQVSSGSCSVSDSIYLRFQKKPEPEFDPVIVQCGETFEPFWLRATFKGATYKWQDGSTDSIYYVTQPGNYNVEVKIGPCVSQASTVVSVSSFPKFSLGPKQIEICEESYRISSPYKNTTWSTGEKGYEIIVTESGTYSATYDDKKCPVTDSVIVTFLRCITKGDIPNIITPNGDTQNQKFFIKKLEENAWSMEVYNRWGNQIYQKENYDNTWDANGITDGVYFYKMQNHNTGQVIKGWVEVVR